MQQSLFRPNAMEHQKSLLHGAVLVVPSMSHITLTLFIVLWIVAALAWLVSNSYARQETVAGWLEPPQGIIKIFPNSAQGSVTQLLVVEGQEVEKDQPLVVIDDERMMASGGSMQSALLDEYATQQRLLQEEKVRQIVLNQTALSDLQFQIQTIQQNLHGLSSQITTLMQRKTLVSKRLQKYQKIRQSGHLSSNDLDKLEEQRLVIESQEQGLLREKVNLQNQLNQNQTQLANLPKTQLNRLAQLDAKISDVSLRVAQLRGQQTYTIHAQRKGTIANLQVTEGQQVDSSVPILSIVPATSQIAAKLLIPVRAVGFIQTAQKISIRYDAFPFQKFGLYQGVITHISDTIMLPNEVHSAPFALQEPAYLVRANLQSQSVSAYGKSLPLKSGMTLSADIELGERSLWEWLFEPIMSLRGMM